MSAGGPAEVLVRGVNPSHDHVISPGATVSLAELADFAFEVEEIPRDRLRVVLEDMANDYFQPGDVKGKAKNKGQGKVVKGEKGGSGKGEKSEKGGSGKVEKAVKGEKSGSGKGEKSKDKRSGKSEKGVHVNDMDSGSGKGGKKRPRWMQIIVYDPDDTATSHTLDVEPGDSIDDVLDMVQDAWGDDEEVVLLTYGKERLTVGKQTLYDYNIPNQARIARNVCDVRAKPSSSSS
jgi:hypothetical protein